MTGEGEIGVGGQKEIGFRQFSEEQGLFGPVSTAEGDEGVGALELPPKEDSRSLIKSLKGGTVEKGRAGKMDPFPEPAQGGGRIEVRGGEFERHSIGWIL